MDHLPLGPDLDRPWLDSPDSGEREFWVQGEVSLTQLWSPDSPGEGEPILLARAA